MLDSTISALVAADPVLASRFIDNKFRAVLDFLLFNKVPVEERPLGNVTHYCVRCEYQSRGLQHFHIQLWIEGAPVMDAKATDEKEILEFINKYATCQVPDAILCPTLYKRVMRFQQHKLSAMITAYEAKKQKEVLVRFVDFDFPDLSMRKCICVVLLKQLRVESV